MESCEGVGSRWEGRCDRGKSSAHPVCRCRFLLEEWGFLAMNPGENQPCNLRSLFLDVKLTRIQVFRANNLERDREGDEILIRIIRGAIKQDQHQLVEQEWE